MEKQRQWERIPALRKTLRDEKERVHMKVFLDIAGGRGCSDAGCARPRTQQTDSPCEWSLGNTCPMPQINRSSLALVHA